jgi:hypothetical protein
MGLAPATGADAQEVQANLEPLRSVVLYATGDGNEATAAGFLGID